MSMIEQVKELRIAEETCRQMGKEGIAKFLSEAADTIESLSEKLQAANMERSADCGGWVDGKKVIEQIENEIDGVIVKDTYSKGKNAGLRKEKIFIEEQMSHEP